MIMELNIRSCPFRKQTTMTHFNNFGHGDAIVNTVYEEEFLECIENKCMLWNQKEHSCLMGRLEKPEEDD